MKNIFVVVILIGGVMLFAGSSAFAEDPVHSGKDTSNKVNWSKAVNNYVHALHSENAGVRQSAESFFNKYKDSKEWQMECVEPLIALLKNDSSKEIRKIAARLLVEVGDARGISAVEEASRTDSSKEVVEFCQWLLNEPEKNKL